MSIILIELNIVDIYIYNIIEILSKIDLTGFISDIGH